MKHTFIMHTFFSNQSSILWHNITDKCTLNTTIKVFFNLLFYFTLQPYYCNCNIFMFYFILFSFYNLNNNKIKLLLLFYSHIEWGGIGFPSFLSLPDHIPGVRSCFCLKIFLSSLKSEVQNHLIWIWIVCFVRIRQDRTFMRTCIRTLWVTPRPWRQRVGGKERTNRSVESNSFHFCFIHGELIG